MGLILIRLILCKETPSFWFAHILLPRVLFLYHYPINKRWTEKEQSPSTGWVWVSKNEIATKWVRYRRIYWWHSLPPSTSMLHPMHALFTVAPPYPRPQTMLKLDDVICFLLPPWLHFHRRRIPKQTFSKVENSLLSVIYAVYSKFLSSWIDFSSGYLKKSKENKAKNEKEVISVHVQR